jgi:phosphoribosyl 1,2-cyclic phosphodiesterase
MRGHMSIEQTREMLLSNDLSKVREIWLIHLSDSNSDAEAFRDDIQAATGKPVYVA